MKNSRFPYNILRFIGITSETSAPKKWLYGGLAVGALIATAVLFALLYTTPMGVAAVGVFFATTGLGAAIGGLIGNLLEMGKDKERGALEDAATLASISSAVIIAATTGLALLLVGSFMALNPGIGMAIWMGVTLMGTIASGLAIHAMIDDRLPPEGANEAAAVVASDAPTASPRSVAGAELPAAAPTATPVSGVESTAAAEPLTSLLPSPTLGT